MSATVWLQALTQARRQRVPAVLVTVTAVRGHAPQEPGAKMVVTADRCWGTVGGGNLEQTAIDRARAQLVADSTALESIEVLLSDRAPSRHGRQCCGGEVTVLLEPVPVPPGVAVFGLGHVGLELARVLSRHDLDLMLVDSRPDQAAAARAAVVDPVAQVSVQHSPLPEMALDQVPLGTHVLFMTHDHAEDFALCDAALRSAGRLGSIRLIGSTAKWRRFEKGLAVEGHSPELIGSIRCPIGEPSAGKEPARIALTVAVDLLGVRTSRAPLAVGTAPDG